MPFYNTQPITGKKLIEAKERASNQDVKILNCAIALMNDNKPITPWLLWKVYKHNFSNIQITSVRRAVNTLIEERKLKYSGGKHTHSITLDNFTTTERVLIVVI